ncbi:MAG TPA: hypothetical protein VGL53_10725, partial [Bryobacteraceae bacterium]
MFVHGDTNPVNFGTQTIFYRWEWNQGTTHYKDPLKAIDIPRSFRIAMFGDSYGAGEGLPNRPLVRSLASLNGLLDDGHANQFSNTPMWDDFPCHDSHISGQNQALRAFLDAHPTQAIEFKNFSCSGPRRQRCHSRADDSGRFLPRSATPSQSV